MELKSIQFKETTFDTSKRIIEGYISTWDQDSVGDIIHPGAFTKSISEGLPAKRIKMLWQHSEPLGMPLELREDDVGVWAKGRISRTQLGDEALELMRDGVVDRFSIGFIIPKGKSTFGEDGTRHIHEVKLLEFSPVTFPANDAAVVTAVKSLSEQIRLAKDTGKDLDEVVKELEQLKTYIRGEALPLPQENDYTKLRSLLSELGDYASKL